MSRYVREKMKRVRAINEGWALLHAVCTRCTRAKAVGTLPTEALGVSGQDLGLTPLIFTDWPGHEQDTFILNPHLPICDDCVWDMAQVGEEKEKLIAFCWPMLREYQRRCHALLDDLRRQEGARDAR